MDKQQPKSDFLLALAGGLMALSAILSAVGGRLLIAVLYGIAAFGMFVAAWNIRQARAKKGTEEESHEEKTV